MQGEDLAEEVRLVAAVPVDGALEVVPQQIAVVGGAHFDDLLGHLAWGERAGIDQTVLGDDDVDRMLTVVDMGDHRYDGRDPAVPAVLGVTMKVSAPLRMKSPEPPMPFIICEPVTWVEFTWP